MSTASIHKISLVLPATSNEEAGKHQSAAKHWAQHRLPELLDQYLAPLGKGEEVVYIEKVTINLPDLPWNLSDADWQQQLAEAIKLSAASADSFVLILRQWLFYLSNGCLEATALLSSRQAIEAYLIKHPDQLQAILVKEAGDKVEPVMWQRLFAQHAETLVTLVLQLLLDIQPSQAIALYPVWKKGLQELPDVVYRQLSELVVMNRKLKANQKAVLLQQVLEGKHKGTLQEEKVESVKLPAGKLDENKAPVGTNAIACSNAGLVLLFPYIKRYFELAGLLAGDAFASDAARTTGVQALYWLATGTAEMPPEELLVLPKLMCGVEGPETVAWEEKLTEAMQTEGLELLEAVIGHWAVLQNTSIDGLRQTFLQRNGKLRLQDDNYTLQVEESGVDILLNSIPWGFRHYRLPWMRRHLITEWY